MGSGFGRMFRVTTFGESHGGALGAVIEGCPPGITLDLEAIQHELDRRRPGQSDVVSPRREPDKLEILSGVFEGRTLGTAIGPMVRNKDADASSYAPFKDKFRPSHADFTTEAKYGVRNWQGGGRSSARETVARVAAGARPRELRRRAPAPANALQPLSMCWPMTDKATVASQIGQRAQPSSSPPLCGGELRGVSSIVDRSQACLALLLRALRWSAALLIYNL